MSSLSDPSAIFGRPLTTAGMSISPLSSSDNFVRWSRDFQSIATHKSLWQYLAGTKKLIQEEPARDDFKDTAGGFNEYRAAKDDYKEQQEKLGSAFNLLHATVAPSIQRSLLEFRDPAEAYLSLKKQYQPSEYRTRQQARARMQEIRLTREKTMGQFIEEIKTCRFDIIDANGTFCDEQVMDKIARSLPKDYDEFVLKEITLVNDAPKLDEIINELLALEPRILQRQKAGNKGQNGDDNNKNRNNNNAGRPRGRGKGQDNNNNGNTKDSKECTGCKQAGRPGRGHTYDECRSTNPTVQAKIIEASKVKQEKTNNDDTVKSDNNKQGYGAAVFAPTDGRRRFAAAVIADLSAIASKRLERAQSQIEGSPGMPTPNHTLPDPADHMTQTSSSSKVPGKGGQGEEMECENGVTDGCAGKSAYVKTDTESSNITQADSDGFASVRAKSRRVLAYSKPIVFSNYFSILSSECPLNPLSGDMPSQTQKRRSRRQRAKRARETDNQTSTPQPEFRDLNMDDVVDTTPMTFEQWEQAWGRLAPDGKLFLASLLCISIAHQLEWTDTPATLVTAAACTATMLYHRSKRVEREGLQRDDDMKQRAEALRIAHRDIVDTSKPNPLNDKPLAEKKNAVEKTLSSPAYRTAMSATQEDISRDVWLLDSGANVHVVNDRRYFVDMQPFQLDIRTASGETSMNVAGEGTAVVTVETPTGEEVELELTGVMYIPTSRCHLVSLSELANKGGFGGVWGSEHVSIDHQGQTICVAKQSHGLYPLPTTQVYPHIPTGTHIAGNVDFSHPVWHWHERLGHPSIENMRTLLKHSKGMNLTDAQLKAKIKATCPTCATTKATSRIPRDPAARQFEEPGDLLHVDIWGSYPVDSYDGTRYFLIVTDDATRYTWAVRLKDKQQLAARLVLLHRRLEKTYKMTIRSYRMDNEIAVADVFKDFVVKKGMTVETTVPFAHYMNGVAERTNRTVREKAATSILHSRIPETLAKIFEGRTTEFLRDVKDLDCLWPDAFEHAIRAKNRTPTRVRKSGKTPWELLLGIIPDLSVERTWGSIAYVTNPPELRSTKLHDARGWRGIFVGVERESVYRVYNPETRKVHRVSMPRIIENRESPTEGGGRQDPGDGDPAGDNTAQADGVIEPATTTSHGPPDTRPDNFYYGGDMEVDDRSPMLDPPDTVSLFFAAAAIAPDATEQSTAGAMYRQLSTAALDEQDSSTNVTDGEYDRQGLYDHITRNLKAEREHGRINDLVYTQTWNLISERFADQIQAQGLGPQTPIIQPLPDPASSTDMSELDLDDMSDEEEDRNDQEALRQRLQAFVYAGPARPLGRAGINKGVPLGFLQPDNTTSTQETPETTVAGLDAQATTETQILESEPGVDDEDLDTSITQPDRLTGERDFMLDMQDEDMQEALVNHEIPQAAISMTSTEPQDEDFMSELEDTDLFEASLELGPAQRTQEPRSRSASPQQSRAARHVAGRRFRTPSPDRTRLPRPNEVTGRMTAGSNAIMLGTGNRFRFAGVAARKRKRKIDDDLDSQSGGDEAGSDVSVPIKMDLAAAKGARAQEAEAQKKQIAAREKWVAQQKKPSYRKCDKCQTLALGLTQTLTGELCRTCASRPTPAPEKCATCPTMSSRKWHQDKLGKICSSCYQKRCKAERNSACAQCKRTTKRTIETAAGDLCITCSNKIPNPDACSACHRPASEIKVWLNSSSGKICQSCDVACRRAGRLKAEPCNRCRNLQLTCDLGNPCGNCVSSNTKICHIPSHKNTIPQTAKCGPCFRKERACNKERPCQRCISTNRQHLCYPHGAPPPQKCTFCETNGLLCDHGRPCRFCVATAPTSGKKQGHPYRCIDIDIHNLVVTVYSTQHEEIKKWKEAEHKSCLRCTQKGYDCTGHIEDGKPCLMCVKQSHHSFCSWTSDEGIMKKFPIIPYHVEYDDHDTAEPQVVRDPDVPAPTSKKDLRDSGRLVTRPERKAYHAKWRTRNQAGNLKLQALAGNSDDELEDAEVADTRVMRSLASHGLNSLAASQEFARQFPHGYRLERTKGTGLLCALRAIVKSLQALHEANATVPVPTFNDLRHWSQSDEYRARVTEFQDPNMLNDGNYHVDQAALIAQLWAERTHAFPLRMGWITPLEPPVLVSYSPLYEGVIDTEPTIFFIHNDNALALFPDNNLLYNHFEGISPVRPSQPTHADAGGDDDDESDEYDDDGPDNDDMDTSEERKARRAEIDKVLASIPDSFEDSASRIHAFANNFAGLSIMDVNLLPEPMSYKEAVSRPDKGKWTSGMDTEMEGFATQAVWEQAKLPEGRKALTVKWVYKYKIGPDGTITRWKARLVVRGFQQEEGIDYYQTYAPVAKHPTYRLLFALAVLLGWPAHQVDILQAFLNSTLQEEVYIRSAPGYPIPKGLVLRLRKALYGLKQASKAWYDTLVAALGSLGFEASPYDPCLFINRQAGVLIVTWVDDMLIFGKDEQRVRRFKDELTSKFAMKDEGPCSYYLGMQVSLSKNIGAIKQSTYVLQSLTKFGLQDIPVKSTPGDPNQKLRRSYAIGDESTPPAQRSRKDSSAFLQKYQSMVGTLNWLATISRPDIAYDTGLVARYNADPCQEHLDAVIHIFAYLKGTTHYGMAIVNNGGGLVGYVDSDYANCEDTRRSTTGFIFFYNGTPVSWRSSRQKLVTGSTCEAEYVAAYEAAKEAIWLRNVILYLGIPGTEIGAVPLYIDNRAARILAENPVHHDRTKHIDIKFHFIRERVQLGQISVREVASKDNIADLLTKTLHKSTFTDLRARANIVEDLGI